MNDTVEILMATYNGEKYVAAQIDSILSQTYKNFKLIIRDDNSTDDTLAVIKSFAEKDSRISVIVGQKNLGPVFNFRELMSLDNSYDYTMFCDQDDVWKKDKIERTLAKMKELESIYAESPILVYTKKQCVDEYLHDIILKEHKYENSLFSVLCQNHIYGCTMMLNKKLKDLSANYPNYVVNHDYWVALNAAAFGIICELDYKSILYRMHNGNVTGGANNLSMQYKIKNFKKINLSLEKTFCQNYRFCKNCAEDNTDANKYIKIVETPLILRAAIALAKGYRMDSFLATMRNLAVLSFAKIR